MSEDPHERELTELEKQIAELELESADETSKKPEDTNKAKLPEETSSEADTYEEKSKEEWKTNDRKPDTKLTYTEEEIEIVEED